MLIGLPSFIFLILSIHSHPPIQHVDSGFISYFHLYLAIFIIPVTFLFPFILSHHLSSNCCHHCLNILPLSFTCFLTLIIVFLIIDVEYIYGFVWWGVCRQKSMTSQRNRATHKMADMRYYDNVMTTTRWRLYVTMETLWQQQDVIDVFYIFNSTVVDWTCLSIFFSYDCNF